MVSHKGRQRLMLAALILVFSMPFVAAWLIYNYSDIGRSVIGNYGELLDPTVSVANTTLLDPLGGDADHSLHRKWNLVYSMAAECTQQCRDRLGVLLGVRSALQKDAARLQLSVTSPEAGFEKNIMEYLASSSGDRILLLPYPFEGPQSATAGVLMPGGFYLIDPLGNLILKYPADSSPEGLISDLKRLLRYSRIG